MSLLPFFLNSSSGKYTLISKSIFSDNDYNSDLTIPGAWTQGATELNASSGGYAECLFDIQTLNEVQKQSISFKLNNATSVIRLFKKPSAASFLGTLVEVNFNTAKLIHYDIWDGTSLPSVLTEIDITIPINTADTYTLSWDLTYYKAIVISLSSIGGNNNITTTNAHLAVRDNAGFAYVSGDVDFYSWIHNSKSNNVRAAYYGDSYIDAGALGPDIDKKFAYLAYEDLPSYKSMISGRGGSGSAELLARISLSLQQFTPDISVINIGYNESVLATFETNLDAIIAAIEAAGSMPVICTLAPVTATLNVAISDDQNTYIKSRGKRLLNISEVLTVGGDEATINTSLILSDNAHPNVQGNSDIYDRLKIEVPEIFL